MTDFSLAEWIGEHSTKSWIFYNAETIMAWLEDGRIYWEVLNE